MRIAFISGMAGAPWGGSEVLWSETAKRLMIQGHEVFASVPRWPDIPAPLKVLIDHGVKVSRRNKYVDLFSKYLRKKIFVNHPIHAVWNPYWNQIVSFKPDLVCISHGSALCGLEWMLRCKEFGFPYVSIAQANFEQWWPDDNVAPAAREAYQSAKRAYFVSKANLELFERQIGTRLSNGEVVFNPFNVSWNADPNWPEDDGMIRLACVARLDPRAKGQDLLFQVLAMQKWRDRPLTVSLIGDGPCAKSLQRLAEMEGISGHVRFAGHVSDIENIWRTHHALILPSRYEGLPLSLVEAMICGRTAIVTDVAGNKELLQDNVTGFVAESPCVKHIDEALERFWTNRNKLKDMGSMASNEIRSLIPNDPIQYLAEKISTVQNTTV